MSRNNRPLKWCAVCGRKIQWRRKWQVNWEDIKYCSAKCRRTPLAALDRELERVILELLAERGAGGSICPSEAAKRAVPADRGGSWRDLMQPVRNAARRLANSRQLVFLQKGRRVDPSSAKGPIRLKRR